MSAKEVDQLLKGQALFDGWELECVGRIQATHSDIFEYHGRSKAGDEQLAVKHITASSNPAETVRREFKAIQIVWALAGQRLDGLPKPLMVLPEAGLMVTEKVSGIPLSKVLARQTNCVMAVFRTANVCDIARRVGGWLSQFHEVTRQPALAHDAKAFDREVTSQLEGCVSRGLGAAAAQEIFRAASKASGLVDGKPLPAAARHGDFTARNILIDSERIGVVDFENFVERDTIYEDLGKFVAYLALLQGRPGYSRAAINAAARCFLSGYGSSDDGKLVRLFALKAAVRMFAYRGTRRMANFLGFDYLYTRQLIRLGACADEALNYF
jgi:tRNA A-37 threonylcarbamoyl transferase component Bud32